jgi:Protein of unknown function (DUF1236)
MAGLGMAGPIRFWPLVVLSVLLGMPNANAQSAGTDEAVTSQGAVIPTVSFTAAQKNAIYNAIVRQRVRAATARIEPTVGAAVPRSVPLAELPGHTGLAESAFLKYAMVADDVVVVDPIEMRVVDVIHGNVGP